MKKLIEKIQGDNLIECDNTQCDYIVSYTSKLNDETIHTFINKPCPRCGENLLTEEDYKSYITLMKVINFINRWFSWLTIFSTKKSWNKRKSIWVKPHNGINISDDPNKLK